MREGSSITPASAELEASGVEDASRRRARWSAWGLTWLSYMTYYLGRKGISVAKAPITEALGKDALLGVETAYSAAYALGQYANGFLGDKVGARLLVGAGMLVSAAACFAFGMSGVGLAFVVAFAVNGYAQSTGWPGNVKAMAEWTTPENRGRVMGFWATCYQVGGIVATSFATFMLVRYGWRAAFWGPALGLGLVGVLVLVLLRPGPGAYRATGPAAEVAAEEAERRAERRRVLGNPTIWCYGASYFGMKLIRYSILFWLPFYMKTVLHYSASEAGYLSNSFEIGGVLGTIGMGVLSDRYRQVPRALLSAVWLLLLAVAIFVYARLGATSMGVNFVVMAFVGALLFGPDSLISGAAAQDAGGKYAAATAAGIVNGVGSMGMVAQELVTRGVSEKYGWGALFYVFVGLATFSAICLVPTFWRRGAHSVK